MESDKNITEPKNSEQIAPTNSEEGDSAAKHYIEMATSMPVISGALSYLSSTYTSVKENNEAMAPLMDGVERSVERVASAAYNITKQVAGSNKEQDKKDNTTQNDPPSEPTSVWNNKISQTILNASNKVLDATVTAVDSYLSPKDQTDPKDRQNENMSSRLSSVAGKARKRIVGMVNDTLETEQKQEDSQVIKTETPPEENKRLLFKVYQSLREKPKNESFILSILRFSAIISVKATLTIQEVLIEPNQPLISRTFYSIIGSAKEASIRMLSPIREAIDKATVPLKSLSKEALDSSLEKSKEFFDYLKGVGLQATANAINYAKTLPSKAYKEVSLRLHELSNPNKVFSSPAGSNMKTAHED